MSLFTSKNIYVAKKKYFWSPMSYLLWVWKKNVYRRAFRFVCYLEQLVYFFSFVNIVIEQKLNIIINISCKCQLGLTQVPTLQSGVQPTKSHYTLLQLTSQHGAHCIIMYKYIVTLLHPNTGFAATPMRCNCTVKNSNNLNLIKLQLCNKTYVAMCSSSMLSLNGTGFLITN